MKQVPVIAFMLTVSVGLVAQTQTAKKPVTKKLAAKIESKEHAAIRTQYEAKIKECEQRWLDAKASAELDKKLVNDKSADLSVAQAEAKGRLAKLKIGMILYDSAKDATKGDPAIACDIHPH